MLQEKAKRLYKEFNITALNLDWEDTMRFTITENDFREAVLFIHQARKSGGAMLVHCAQVGLSLVPICRNPPATIFYFY